MCVTFPLPDVHFRCDLCFIGTLTGQDVLVLVLFVLLVFRAVINETNETRTNCSRKVHEIESGSWQRSLGRRRVICKRPAPPDGHLQETGPSV